MTRRAIPTIVLAAILSGCVASAVQQWTDAANIEHARWVAATQRAADYRTIAEGLPPGLTREKAISASTQAAGVANVAAAKAGALNDLIGAQKADDSAAVGRAVGNLLTGVPVVGQYAPIIGYGCGLLFGIIAFIQRKRRADAIMNLDAVINSVERAGPDWTEADKIQIAALQGPKTTAAVTAAKKRLGLP
jgi:hypothetical protein